MRFAWNTASRGQRPRLPFFAPISTQLYQPRVVTQLLREEIFIPTVLFLYFSFFFLRNLLWNFGQFPCFHSIGCKETFKITSFFYLWSYSWNFAQACKITFAYTHRWKFYSRESCRVHRSCAEWKGLFLNNVERLGKRSLSSNWNRNASSSSSFSLIERKIEPWLEAHKGNWRIDALFDRYLVAGSK